jgi:hypothetical protein
LNKKQDGNLVKSMFVQYASNKLTGGKDWDEAFRAQFLKNTYDTIEEYAPGFAKSVVHAYELLRPDMVMILD